MIVATVSLWPGGAGDRARTLAEVEIWREAELPLGACEYRFRYTVQPPEGGTRTAEGLVVHDPGDDVLLLLRRVLEPASADRVGEKT